MYKTVVEVMFSMAGFTYTFNISPEKFEVAWDYQIEAVGYFTGTDVNGDTIIINPRECGAIRIYSF